MPTFVQQAVARADSVTSLPISFGSAVTTGSKVYLTICAPDAITGVSGLTGASWTQLAATAADSNGNHLEVWEGDGATGGTTVTATCGAATFAAMSLAEWSGVGYVGVIGSTVVHATTVTTPAQHLFATGDVVYGAVTWSGGAGTTFTDAPGAWTSLTQQDNNNISESLQHCYRVAASSSEDPTRQASIDAFARPFKAWSIVLAASPPPSPPPRLVVAQRAALTRASSW